MGEIAGASYAISQWTLSDIYKKQITLGKYGQVEKKKLYFFYISCDPKL